MRMVRHLGGATSFFASLVTKKIVSRQLPYRHLPPFFHMSLNDNRPDELAPVYDYREDNYIGRLRSHRRSAPTFPIALWNMRSRVTDGLTRTNDSVEGWHHAFQSSVACHHPNTYKLIEHIQTEPDHTEQHIARFNAGNQTSVSSKNRYIQVTRRLTALLPTYGNRPLLQYLRGIAHNIKP